MKSKINRFFSLLLIFSLLFTVVPYSAFANTSTPTQVSTVLLPSDPILQQANRNMFSNIKIGRYDGTDLIWRILDTKTSTGQPGFFLLSDSLFRAEMAFDADSNKWQGSAVQDWCKSMGNASFTTAELAAIMSTSKSDAAYDHTIYPEGQLPFTYEYPASANILNNDKFFLLSAEEAASPTYGLSSDSSRIATAVWHGALGSYEQAHYWWLRTPGTTDNSVAHVSDTGRMTQTTYTGQDYMRPAFNILADEIYLLQSISCDKNQFGMLGTNSFTTYKLTLRDDNDFSTGASVNKTALAPGETLTISHKSLTSFNAGYGDVTALLLNEAGKPVAYGIINEDTSATQSQITIPFDLAEGNYTLSICGETIVGQTALYTSDQFRADFATGTPFIANITVSKEAATTYKVDFNANGGSGTMSQIIAEAGPFTLPECTFVAPTGKQFKGWSDQADGNIIAGMELTTDITLYAIWETIPLPVVSNVAVTGVTAPVTFDKASFSASVEPSEKLNITMFCWAEMDKAPLSSFQVDSATWYSSNDDMSFQQDKYYVLVMRVKPKDGYLIPSDENEIIATVNGNAATFIDGYPSANHMFIYYNFGTPAAPTIRTVTITGVMGENATYNGVAQKGYTGIPINYEGYTGEYTVTYSGRNETVYNSTTPPILAGDYTVTISVPADNVYYKGSTSLDFTIGKKAVTVMADNKTVNQGDPLPAFTFQVEGLNVSDAFTDPIIQTVDNTNSHGQFDIVISGGTLSNAENYEITYEKGRLTVNQTVFTVNFDVNGGNAFSPDSSQTGFDGKLASLPTASKENYSIKGWFDAPTGGNQITTDTVFIADTTVYAQWALCDHVASTNQPTCTNTAICSVCNGTIQETAHRYDDLKHNDTQHWLACAVCGKPQSKENHKDGTATCTEKAKCSVCGEAYGDAPSHGETELKNAKSATVEEDGYTGDKHCKVCGEKLESGNVIPKLETEAPETEAPETGEASTKVIWILLLISGLGAVALLHRKKKVKE